jgi:hypothetical protein
MSLESATEDADFSMQGIVVTAACRGAGAAVAARAGLERGSAGKGGRIGRCGDVDLARGDGLAVGRGGTDRWGTAVTSHCRSP